MVVKEQLELIFNYFPELSDKQKEQLEKLFPLYSDWNDKINVISRKDIGNLYLHHVLHSLVQPKVFKFKAGAQILDLGTGGGFPGIPLAIYYPEVEFHLIDARAKKLTVVEAVAQEIGLKNVRTTHTRIEEMKGPKYDFVLSRAVKDLDVMLKWSRPHIKKEMQHAFPNGLVSYTGGSEDKKLAALHKREYTETFPISDYYKEEYFENKFIVYIQA